MVGSSFLITFLVVVAAKQLGIELGNVVWSKTIATVKCLINGLYSFLNQVVAIMFIDSVFLRGTIGLLVWGGVRFVPRNDLRTFG